jgi:hypothetical protein
MFYKNDNGSLLKGNRIKNENYYLYSDDYDKYDYPIDGWYWFYSDEKAYEFFGIEPFEELELPPPEINENEIDI